MIWTREAILDAIRTWTKNHGYPPSTQEWRHAGYGHPCEMTVRRAYGSFRDAVYAAGIAPRLDGPEPFWTRERCQLALKVWRVENGHWPSQRDWARPGVGHPTWKTVQRKCGGWQAALRRAGQVGKPNARERRETTRRVWREARSQHRMAA